MIACLHFPVEEMQDEKGEKPPAPAAASCPSAEAPQPSPPASEDGPNELSMVRLALRRQHLQEMHLSCSGTVCCSSQKGALLALEVGLKRKEQEEEKLKQAEAAAAAAAAALENQGGTGTPVDRLCRSAIFAGATLRRSDASTEESSARQCENLALSRPRRR